MTDAENITNSANSSQRDLYVECVQKQLDELEILNFIFSSPDLLHVYDPTIISDFHDYIAGTLETLRSQLDFGIFFKINDTTDKVEVHVELPHLYPAIENAIFSIRSVLLPKSREKFVKNEIENYVATVDKSCGYVFQVIDWIKDHFDEFLETNNEQEKELEDKAATIEYERVWIYSHHIKNKMKRQEIVRKARELDLTGFSRPGKPGIICIEGIKENTQQFWRTIKALHWQKITIKHLESKQILQANANKWRRFTNFKEEIFADVGEEEVKMDMSMFMKFLDDHNCGYIKKELFGFE